MKKLLLQSVFVLFTIIGFNCNLFAQKLYCTSPSGDAIFSYDIGSNAVAQLGLLNTANIDHPKGKLVHIGNGEFIGITENSPNLFGGIYKTDTTTNSVTLLYEFIDNSNKAQSSFVLANNGKLYCLGYTGTAGNESGIYSFDLSTNAYTNEYDITGHANTGDLGGMVKANNGLLYGITQKGGANDKGILFSFNTSNSTFTKLYDFNTSSGTKPVAALIQATNGKLYGVTSHGGINDKGVIFSFDISSNTYSKLYDFVQSNGENPTSPLYQASDGKLYGTTMSGGSNFLGVLYSFNISTNTYSNLHNFSSNGGYGPRTYPIEGITGVLFGTTNQGGANFRGSIYKFDINSATFTKLMDGNDTNAGNFVSPFFSFSSPSTGINELNNTTYSLSLFPNPCKDRIQLLSVDYPSTYQIYNQMGQVICSGALSNPNEMISTSQLRSGIYIIVVTNNKTNSNQLGRFVKE